MTGATPPVQPAAYRRDADPVTGVALVVAAIRTIVWFPLLTAGTVVLVLLAGLFSLFWTYGFFLLARCWSRWHRGCARLILRQRLVIEGVAPRGPVFFVMKHESAFETVDLPLLLDRPVVYAKLELFSIPVWGKLARTYGLIPIERSGGSSAMRQMRGAGLAAIAAGRPLVLFPEGTRVPHGEHPSIRAGFAGLYKLLGLPVVPVALDSGRLARANGWIRLPGQITYRFGEAIPPGLPREEAEERVHAAINALNRAPLPQPLS